MRISTVCSAFAFPLIVSSCGVAGTPFPHVPNRGGASVQRSKQQRQQQQDVTVAPTMTATGRNNKDEHTQQQQEQEELAQSACFEDPLLEATFIAETDLPTDFGDFRLRAYRTAPMSNPHSGNEPMVIYAADKPPFGTGGRPREGLPVRVHDQCMTSEVFGSNRCDCKEQLRMALLEVKKNGGAVIYLQQEGRGIGLANKVAAYSLQDRGYDTVDANVRLGFAADARQYGMIPSILEDLRVESIRLMTNNPRKVHRLAALGVRVEGTVPVVVHRANPHNRKYLETKQERMNHLNFGDMLRRDDAAATTMATANEHMRPKAFIVVDKDSNDYNHSNDDEAPALGRPKLLGGASTTTATNRNWK